MKFYRVRSGRRVDMLGLCYVAQERTWTLVDVKNRTIFLGISLKGQTKVPYSGEFRTTGWLLEASKEERSLYTSWYYEFIVSRIPYNMKWKSKAKNIFCVAWAAWHWFSSLGTCKYKLEGLICATTNAQYISVLRRTIAK